MSVHKNNVFFTGTLAACLLLSACGAEKEKNGGGVVAPFLKTEDVSTNGCLNLQLLNNRIRNFPSGIMIRSYTPDIQVGGTDSDMKLAALKGAFRFTESPASDGTFLSKDVRQLGCEKVGFLDEDQNEEDYDVTAFTENEITLSRKGEKNLKVTLSGEQKLSVLYSYKTFNDCGANQDINITVLSVFKWGNENALTEEAISNDTYFKLKSASEETHSPAPLTPPTEPEAPVPTPEETPTVPEDSQPDETTPPEESLLARAITSTNENEIEENWTLVPVEELLELQAKPTRSNLRFCSPSDSKPISVNPDDAPEEEDDQWGTEAGS